MSVNQINMEQGTQNNKTYRSPINNHNLNNFEDIQLGGRENTDYHDFLKTTLWNEDSKFGRPPKGSNNFEIDDYLPEPEWEHKESKFKKFLRKLKINL